MDKIKDFMSNLNLRFEDDKIKLVDTNEYTLEGFKNVINVIDDSIELKNKQIEQLQNQLQQFTEEKDVMQNRKDTINKFIEENNIQFDD